MFSNPWVILALIVAAIVVLFLLLRLLDWFFAKQEADHGLEVARKKSGTERSSQWDETADAHLKKNPKCAACGYGVRRYLQVHHIKPFHLHPELELDPDNLITLCVRKTANHHLLLGHLNLWESYNVHVKRDCKRFYKMSGKQIKADDFWQERVSNRPEND